MGVADRWVLVGMFFCTRVFSMRSPLRFCFSASAFDVEVNLYPLNCNNHQNVPRDLGSSTGPLNILTAANRTGHPPASRPDFSCFLMIFHPESLF
ncbi:hypothetical protein F4814DRAFT_117090 [Daldinia grandis]|nr:hypothetical protein F4814DRAFT_117090 [Daldinia grandis]